MHSNQSQPNWVLRGSRLLGGVLMAAAATLAQAITINVVRPDGTPINVPFRWTLQEDKTFDSVPGLTGTADANTLSLQFHRSYMPVIESGQTAATTGTAATTTNLTAAAYTGKRYFLSVLPNAGIDGAPAFQMSGVPIRPNANGSMPGAVTVVVNPTPVQTAQISVLLFHDSNPINNSPDAIGGQEYGLCGWDIHLYDAGGTYGASGGRFGYDAFGNPLGTTYLPNGDVDVVGTLDLKTDANGVFRIKNLAPAKYTVYAIPPAVKPPQSECPRYYPEGTNAALTPWPEDGQFWMQTHTIEGTQGVDAWIKSNEPAYFKEFGPPGHHVFIGFVPSFTAPGGGAGVATGQVINIHMSRPPNFTFNDGPPVGECRVGLNESASLAVGGGRGVYAGRCNSDGSFSIPGLKPNTRYQLAVWDKPLDNVFGLYDFITTANPSVNLGKVPVFNWFGRVAGKVCHDPLATGQCSADATGIPGQAVNLRFRDGSIYQSAATDDEGNYEFSEVFPFFNWLVAEVDYLRFEATGLTALADAGGALPANPTWPNRGRTTPYAGGAETTTGPAILQGVQTFLGQTNILDFGKRAYVGTANGGISGKVNYSSTRAESDPRYAGAENNEPGIPGVTVRLYRASPSNPRVALASQPAGFPMIAVSDAWDAALPTDCAADPTLLPAQLPPFKAPTDCYDGLRNFNQAKSAVYDGGYAFVDLDPGYYIVEVVPPPGYEVQKEEDKNVDFGDTIEVSTLALPPECVGSRSVSYHGRPAVGPVPAELDLFPGVAIPPEYGDAPGKPRPYCNRKAVTLSAGLNAANDFHLFTKTPVAGHIVGMILDDLANEFNPNAPTFGEKFAPPYMPVSLRDHTGREFSRVYSDRFGTYNALVPSTFAFNVPMPSGISPNMVSACLNSPFMPVKNPTTGADVLDPITGQPMMQPDPHHNKSYSQFCYTFQYLPGKTTYLDTPVLPIAAFAGPQQFSLDCAHPDLVPAIRSVNNALLNNSGPYVAGTSRQLRIQSMGPTQVLNPLWDSANPGAAVPKTITRNFGFGATRGAGQVSINGSNVPAGNIVSWNNDEIVINVPSTGAAFTNSGTLLVTHNNGNGSPRGVTVHIGGSAPTVVRAGGSIQAAVNAAAEGALITVEPGIYEETVIVDRRVRLQGFGAGGTLINAVTQPAEKLQAWRKAICDKVMGVLATPGGGTGLAGGARFLLPGQVQPTTYDACLTGDTADNAPLLFGDAEAPGFFVMLKSDGAANPQPRAITNALQIDGFTISGADQGGGIIANGYARALQITNNVITGNQGIMAGGIRLGHPTLTTIVVNPDATDQILPVGSRNTDVVIRNNEIVQNGDTAGATGGGGGGIGIYIGANNYNVTKNYVCGNFSTGNGGGLAHLGVSDRGSIHDNKFLWNASFNQGASVQGGAISIAGQASTVAANGLSTGSGSVRISNNTILGNLAGAGDGGGISLLGTNGNELVSGSVTTQAAAAYLISIVNNVIVNNVAGVAGGGVALQDAPNTEIINNTIARNDNVSTAARAFLPGPQQNNTTNTALSSSLPQFGAGIASYPHSPVLAARLVAVAPPSYISRVFSGPYPLDNNIIYQNRVFHWNQPAAPTPTNPAGLVFDGFSDLEVLDSALPAFAASNTNNAPGTYIPATTAQARMCPMNSVMTSIAGYGNGTTTTTPTAVCNSVNASTPNGNVAGLQTNVQYWNANTYNGARDSILLQLEASVQATAQSPAVQAAFDEGGNFIDVRFGPLTQRVPATGVPYFDYRIRGAAPNSQAVGIGQVRNGYQVGAPRFPSTLLDTDRNGVTRGGTWDAGAYEGSTSATSPY